MRQYACSCSGVLEYRQLTSDISGYNVYKKRTIILILFIQGVSMLFTISFCGHCRCTASGRHSTALYLLLLSLLRSIRYYFALEPETIGFTIKAETHNVKDACYYVIACIVANPDFDLFWSTATKANPRFSFTENTVVLPGVNDHWSAWWPPLKYNRFTIYIYTIILYNDSLRIVLAWVRQSIM